MKYNGLTSVGSIYQAKCAANNIPVKFVKVKVGNGLLEETENPLNFTDIKSLKKEVGISEITQINEAVRLTVPLDNDGVTEGYYPREFGIYVEDDGVEVLYWYINDGQEASYLPPQNSAPVKIKNHFNIIATSLESLIVNWAGKEFWVDKEYLGKELIKKLNIGNVEKEIETAEDILKLIKGNVGIVEIKNIQDPGIKTKGEIYWDNSVSPKVPYFCIKTTSDITPTSNFVAADNKSLAEHNVYEYIDFSSAHANLNKASLEVYGKLCVLSAEILTGTANTLVMSDIIPEGYESRIQVRVGGVSRDVNPKGVSVDIQGRSIQVISYGQNPYVIYTTASWIRA